MKYSKEFELLVDGEPMRCIQAWGNEAELSRLVDVEAGEKGWALHMRKAGEVVLRKPYAKAATEPAVQRSMKEFEAHKLTREQLKAAEAAAEWDDGMRRTEALPDGRVVCARCAYIDRASSMHGMHRCSSPASRSSAAGRAAFYGPFYVRSCNNYIVAQAK